MRANLSNFWELYFKITNTFKYDSFSGLDQLGLKLKYKELRQSGNLPSIRDVGFKAFSQSDEDGILLYIFSLIGTTNKLCIEICAGDGIECNTANLLINHGFYGLLVDGNPKLIKRGRAFYSKNINTKVYPPKLICDWITKDNINDIIVKNGFKGEIDLLSIDLDGNDYWIWESISAVNPRVVVAEYLDIAGPEKSITIPYTEKFNAWEHPTTLGNPNYCGASLNAFVKLAKKKGYRLVGCNHYGYNAFFIKEDLGLDILPTMQVKECFLHPKYTGTVAERWDIVKDYPWVEV